MHPYKNGRLVLTEPDLEGDGEDDDNNRLIRECTQNCKCHRCAEPGCLRSMSTDGVVDGSTCPMRVVQHGLSVALELFRTVDKDWGVRAGQSLSAVRIAAFPLWLVS
jgi:hypothetical protein